MKHKIQARKKLKKKNIYIYIYKPTVLFEERKKSGKQVQKNKDQKYNLKHSGKKVIINNNNQYKKL